MLQCLGCKKYVNSMLPTGFPQAIDGDLAVCVYCGYPQFLMFETFTFRDLTMEERIRFHEEIREMTTPEALALHESIMRQISGKKLQ